MLKKLALLIPHLRNLYDERNRYAQSVQRLETEKSQLQLKIELINQSCSKNELNDLSEIVNALSKVISGLDEKISAHLIPKEENSLTKHGDDFSLSDRGLFVVGHARSGTTILLDALNSSRDVYCLGEANLHKTIERTDFSCWFNAMHMSFNNPLMKSSYLPDFPDLSGWSVLQKMSENYKFIGEKVAFRQEELGYDYASFFNFSAKYFQLSNFICVIRHPRNVSASNIEMFMSGRLDDNSLEAVAISQMQSYYLIMSLVLTLKNVFVVIHERIHQETFNRLGGLLGVNFDVAGSYYDFKKTVTSPDFVGKVPTEGILKVINFYDRFVNLFCPRTLRPINNLRARDLTFDLYAELKLLNRLPKTGVVA